VEENGGPADNPKAHLTALQIGESCIDKAIAPQSSKDQAKGFHF